MGQRASPLSCSALLTAASAATLCRWRELSTPAPRLSQAPGRRGTLDMDKWTCTCRGEGGGEAGVRGGGGGGGGSESEGGGVREGGETREGWGAKWGALHIARSRVAPSPCTFGSCITPPRTFEGPTMTTIPLISMIMRVASFPFTLGGL